MTPSRIGRGRIGIQLRPQATTMVDLRRAWREGDEIGVDSIWLWDHFYPLYGNPDASHFECYAMLAALAADTTTSRLGALVTCNSYRNPHLLADMARTINHISGGRFILGIGSGWFERDYDEYGYEFGTAIGRLHALRDNLPIIKERLAKLNPAPVNGHVPILIGGGGEKVTLRLVAEHGDAFNVIAPLENFVHKSAVVDRWCEELGRDPAEIERTVLVPADQLDDAAAYIDAGADLLIVSMSHPFDLTAVEAAITRLA